VVPHRAFAAFAAIWERLRGLSVAALAGPPFRPASRPRATAWGFLVGPTDVGEDGRRGSLLDEFPLVFVDRSRIPKYGGKPDANVNPMVGGPECC
jgi:hypothetical protein